MRIFLSCFLTAVLFASVTAPVLSAADDKPAPTAGSSTDSAGSLRFGGNDKGTVVDRETGLMWIIDANIGKFPVPWETSKQYIKDMNSGTVPNYGYQNWRLPTISDLESLLDKDQSSPALPPDHPFVNVQNDFYWSSSTGIDIIENVWSLNMASGNTGVDYPSFCSFRFFWPVRSTMKNVPVHQGTVFTGGMNKNGQLGDGSREDRASFMPLKKLNDIVTVAAGERHAMAVKADGTVWVWGDNHDGQLGLSAALTESRIPVKVNNLRTVEKAAAGSQHSAVLMADGTVWAWGQNSYGQLGILDTLESRVPLQVKGLNKVTKIAAGANHTLAVKTDGTVWAWGQNLTGQLGVGNVPSVNVPMQIRKLSKVVAIACGTNHTLAIKSDGTIWAWGDNSSGQLGDGTVVERHLPVQVAGLSHVIDIAAGQDHSLALKDDGTVWAWGRNEFNQLGPLAAAQISTPTQVEGVSNARKIAAGTYHSIALLTDRTVTVWGKNREDIDLKSRPYTITYLKDIFDMAAGRYFTVILSEKAAME